MTVTPTPQPTPPVRRASIVMPGAELRRFQHVTWTDQDQKTAERTLKAARDKLRQRRR